MISDSEIPTSLKQSVVCLPSDHPETIISTKDSNKKKNSPIKLHPKI